MYCLVCCIQSDSKSGLIPIDILQQSSYSKSKFLEFSRKFKDLILYQYYNIKILEFFYLGVFRRDTNFCFSNKDHFLFYC